MRFELMDPVTDRTLSKGVVSANSPTSPFIWPITNLPRKKSGGGLGIRTPGRR
jgi:hypothetical protein